MRRQKRRVLDQHNGQPRRPAAGQIASNVLVGSLAGIAATAVMTSFMTRAHKVLPHRLRYELPPRAIIDRVAKLRDEENSRDATVAAHFGFGALAGILLAFASRASLLKSCLFGTLVWTASYLGWIPFFRILRPATTHPPARNTLMLVAHVVWGASAAIALHELRLARARAFAARPFGGLPSMDRRRA